MLSELFRKVIDLFNWFFTVAKWEQGIRVRLGKYVTLLQPGWYVRIPFVDRIYRQSVRMRRFCVRAQTLTTKDGHVVSVSSAIGFKIVDILRMFDALDDPNNTLECEVSGIVADWIGKTNLKDCNLVDLETHVRATLDLERYGLGAQQFNVTSFAAAKTYRLITGDLPNWNRDRDLQMQETRNETSN